MPLAATWSERFYQPRLADAKVDSPDFTGFHRISPDFTSIHSIEVGSVAPWPQSRTVTRA
jgi:hypothetical protein